MPKQTIDSTLLKENSGRAHLLTAYVLYIRLWLNIARCGDLSEEDAEDIVHTVLVSILSDGKRSFESVEHARNYVAKSVMNRARETRMKGSRRMPWGDFLEDHFSVRLDEYGFDELKRREALRRVICGLPKRDFNIIKFRFFSGFTLAEAAELLSMPISTISSREGVLLVKMRELMRKLGYGGANDPY
jgi:RNA polymerase sigma factor (sigma-70 family)